MQYKLAIFDMDGTILDTLEDLTNTINYALTANNFPIHTIEEVKSFVGNGLGVLVDKACPYGTPEEKKSEVFAVFKDYYKEHSTDFTRPYEGVIELIKELRANGVLTAVVSNKQHNAVIDLCQMFFSDLFDAAMGEKKGIARKPAPDSVNAILSELNLTNRDAIYIGDSDVDIMTAKNSNMDCISVTWGFRDEDFLISNGATSIVHTPSEIIPYIL